MWCLPRRIRHYFTLWCLLIRETHRNSVILILTLFCWHVLAFRLGSPDSNRFKSQNFEIISCFAAVSPFLFNSEECISPFRNENEKKEPSKVNATIYDATAGYYFRIFAWTKMEKKTREKREKNKLWDIHPPRTISETTEYCHWSKAFQTWIIFRQLPASLHEVMQAVERNVSLHRTIPSNCECVCLCVCSLLPSTISAEIVLILAFGLRMNFSYFVGWFTVGEPFLFYEKFLLFRKTDSTQKNEENKIKINK